MGGRERRIKFFFRRYVQDSIFHVAAEGVSCLQGQLPDDVFRQPERAVFLQSNFEHSGVPPDSSTCPQTFHPIREGAWAVQNKGKRWRQHENHRHKNGENVAEICRIGRKCIFQNTKTELFGEDTRKVGSCPITSGYEHAAGSRREAGTK